MPLIGLEKVTKAIVDIKEDTNDFVKSVWVNGLTDIVTATPVYFDDGGRLRNNWFLTTRAPSKQTRGKNKRGNASYSSIGKMPDYILDKTVYFTNNMDYATVIEYGGYPQNPKYGTWTGSSFQKLSQNGYSKQAPAGMVRINLKKMANKL